MTEKELKKLSRADLLEMLIAQSIELESCKAQLAEAQDALKNREIVINQAGSIAEASLVLSGIFDAAQTACREYTDNIRKLSERQETICAQVEAESQIKAQEIIAEAHRIRDDMISQAKAESDAIKMRRKSRKKSKRH